MNKKILSAAILTIIFIASLFVVSDATVHATWRLRSAYDACADYWSYTYGGSQNDYCYALQATSDGGGVVVGLTESFGVGYRDIWVLKLDNQGNISWQKRYGGSGLDAAYSVLQNSDGGYIVQGYTGSYGAGDFDILLLKLDSNGNIIWQKAYGGPNFERGYSIKQTLDNGLCDRRLYRY